MTQQFYRAAIGAFIINEHNEILITLNYGNDSKWNFPKGGIRAGESDEQALKRELQEELGIKDFKMLAKSKISVIYRLPEEYIKQEKLNYIGQAQRYYWLFLSKNTKLNVPNDEVEKYKWIKINSKEITIYFKAHDDEKILQTYVPIEFEEIQLLINHNPRTILYKYDILTSERQNIR